MKVLNILVRRYLPLEELDQAVAFHETLIGQTARLRFDYPEDDLEARTGRLDPVHCGHRTEPEAVHGNAS